MQDSRTASPHLHVLRGGTALPPAQHVASCVKHYLPCFLISCRQVKGKMWRYTSKVWSWHLMFPCGEMWYNTPNSFLSFKCRRKYFYKTVGMDTPHHTITTYSCSILWSYSSNSWQYSFNFLKRYICLPFIRTKLENWLTFLLLLDPDHTLFLASSVMQEKLSCVAFCKT